MDTTRCPICLSEDVEYVPNEIKLKISCKLCGIFNIIKEINYDFFEKNISAEKRSLTSSWIRENQNFTIESAHLDFLFDIKRKVFFYSIEKFFLYIKEKTEFFGQYIQCNFDDKILQTNL